MHSLNNTLRQGLRLHTRTVTNTPLFLALIQKNIDVEKTLNCSAAKSRLTYQSNLLTLSPAERPDTVRTIYDLVAESAQIRDLQLLLWINTSNQRDTISCDQSNQHTIRQNLEHAVFERFKSISCLKDASNCHQRRLLKSSLSSNNNVISSLSSMAPSLIYA